MAGYGKTIIRNKHSEISIHRYSQEWSTSSDCCEKTIERYDYCAQIYFDGSSSWTTLCLKHFFDLFGKHPKVREIINAYVEKKASRQHFIENVLKYDPIPRVEYDIRRSTKKNIKEKFQEIFGEFVENE